MPKSTAYTQPPTWFTKNAKNKDAVLELSQRGWVAVFPDGRTEVVVGMKNVPKEFIKGARKQEPAKPSVVEEPKQEEKVEVPVTETKVEEPKEVKEEKKPSKKKKTPEVTTEK